MPFDFARIQPPEDMFTPGHDYSYDIASGINAFEIKVPEPATLVLIVTAMVIMTRLRRITSCKNRET